MAGSQCFSSLALSAQGWRVVPLPAWPGQTLALKQLRLKAVRYLSCFINYWGCGWWGYAYSGVASAGSFPWNNQRLCVDQSPLYHADKINTPLLLIDGDSDTNVPVSESHSMYTALKLLAKEVDLIEFKGQNHTFNQRSRRLVWWDTILVYFDQHLKDQPQWWDKHYPNTVVVV